MSSPVRVWHFLAAPLLAAAMSCTGSTAPDASLPQLPSSATIRGSAAGTFADGHTVDCTFQIILTLNAPERPIAHRQRYTGSMGGEAYRQVLAADGSGFAFFADMAWPTIEARVIGPDSIEFVLGPGAPDSRFWDSFKLLAGRRTGEGHWSGDWPCDPLDVNSGGYVDIDYSGTGSWVLDVP